MKSDIASHDSSRRVFVTAQAQLSVGNAVAAIILLEDARYVLQLRDDIEPIWYPGHWGCFGGAVEPGEDPVEALRREVREELAVEIESATFFTEFQFDLAGLKLGRYYRKYYVVPMAVSDLSRLCLGEGVAVEAFDSETMLGKLNISPYDAFALFLHARASRLEKLSEGGL